MKPNIVVLTIGCSGSTLLCRMLEKLGWNLPGADEEFAECRLFRKINSLLIKNRHVSKYRFKQLDDLLKANQPWAIKDPRFLHTFNPRSTDPDHWECLGDASLIWISRNREDVRRSMERRGWFHKNSQGEFLTRGITLQQAEEKCQLIMDLWPYPKIHVTHEQLVSASLLLDHKRLNDKFLSGIPINEDNLVSNDPVTG